MLLALLVGLAGAVHAPNAIGSTRKGAPTSPFLAPLPDIVLVVTQKIANVGLADSPAIGCMAPIERIREFAAAGIEEIARQRDDTSSTKLSQPGPEVHLSPPHTANAA